MRHAKQTGRGASVKAPIFFGALALLMVFSLLLPLRPTFSPAEKRELAKYPDFTTQALLSGRYFHDIDTWFSDTFPVRDVFFEINEFIRSTYGYRGAGQVFGTVTTGDAIPDGPFLG